MAELSFLDPYVDKENDPLEPKPGVNSAQIQRVR